MSLLSRLPDGIEVITHKSQDDWLEFRQGASVGASEVADVLNIEGCYMGAYALACQKLGTEFTARNMDDLEFGSAFEPGIITMFEKKSGIRVERVPPFTTFQNRMFPGLFATPDAIYADKDGNICPLEAKFIRPSMIEDWDVEPPLIYFTQLQTQMICMGAQSGSIAGAFIGDFKRQMRYQTVERHPGLCAVIVREVAAFCQMVKRGELPIPDGHDKSTEALSRRHPKEKDAEPPVWLDDGVDLYAEFHALTAEKKAAETRLDALKNRIKARIGDSLLGKFDGGQFSWKYQGGSLQDWVKVPIEHRDKLAQAGIPFETQNTPESRVLRAKKEKK